MPSLDLTPACAAFARPLTKIAVMTGVIAALLTGGIVRAEDGQREIVLRLPMQTAGPNTMDPVRGSSQYDNKACNMVFETLLEYEYFQRPYKLKPCLLAEM